MENYLKANGMNRDWKKAFNDMEDSDMIEICETLCMTTKEERKQRTFQMVSIRKGWIEAFHRKSGGMYLLMRGLFSLANMDFWITKNPDDFKAWDGKYVEISRCKAIWDIKEWECESLRDQLEGKGTMSKEDHDYIVNEKDQEIQRLTDNLRMENKKFDRLQELFRDLEQKKQLQTDTGTENKIKFLEKEIKRLSQFENKQLTLANQK
jgi:hypothetical protein